MPGGHKMKKKRLIPFSWMPASWGLKGRSRLLAEAEYYYEGEDLERHLIPINYPDQNQVGEATREVLKIDLKYGKIDQFVYDEQIATLDATSAEDAEIRRLNVQFDHDRISATELEKQVAVIKQEPWVNIVKMEINPETATAGYVELDWNDHFIKMLTENGYTGRSDEDIVNRWFNDVCRTVLIQELADQDYGLEDQNTQERPDVIRTTNKTKPRNSRKD
jgi:hypothetical protein